MIKNRYLNFKIILTATLFVLTTTTSTSLFAEESPISQSEDSRVHPETTSDGISHQSQGTQSPAAETDSSLDFLMLAGQEILKGTSSPKDLLNKVNPVHQKVVMMISENCEKDTTQTGSIDICERVFSDKSKTRFLTESELLGDEMRTNTTIIHVNAEGVPESQKTIYHGIQYKDVGDNQIKEFEFFDIANKEVDEPSIKEVVVYDYYQHNGKVEKVTWGQYKEPVGGGPNEIIYHAELSYDEQGEPYRGVVEGRILAKHFVEFLNWDRDLHSMKKFDAESWQYWESWISQRSLHSALS